MTKRNKFTPLAAFHAAETCDWQRDRADAEDLLRAVAPDLFDCGMPVYLLSIRQVRTFAAGCDVDGDMEKCRAFTNTFLSLKLRPALERLGMWRGAGFAAVFDVDALDTPAKRLGTALHELVHFVDSEEAEFVRDFLYRDNEMVVKETALAGFTPDQPCFGGWQPPDNRPYCGSFHHSPQFHRIAQHLAFRANRAGWQGDFFDVVTWHYGLNVPVERWWQSLGLDWGELKKLADVPITKVLATTPPRHFRRLAAKALKRRDARYRRQIIRWAVSRREKQIADGTLGNGDLDSSSVAGGGPRA